MAEEGALPFWKRRLLARLVDGRDLVVMGCSGLDFDICSILFQTRYDRMFWLFAAATDFEAAIIASSPNARNVHREAERFDSVFGVLGDFDAIFDGLVDDANYRFMPSTMSTTIQHELFADESSDPFGYRLWRCRLLHAISCRVGSEAVCAAMSTLEAQRPEALRLFADTFERAGRYSDSNAIMARLELMFADEARYDDALGCCS